MASTYSALKIELIATGEQSGTWGATTNVNLGDAALGEAITGSADVAFSSADVTVTLTDVNTTQTARNLRLNLTGTSGGARNLILGSGCQIEKLYLVNNGLADAVTVKNTSGTGIAVPAGKTMFVYNNGTNVVEAVNSAVTLDATTIDTTNLEVTNLKAKDGTASSTIANSTGVMTVASSVLTTTDINGGTIDGTTIGVSSASTGAFTTLTSNGATTFTAGTASTSTTTGTTVITGGLGVSGRVNAANFDGIVGANTAAAGSFTTINASTSITNAGLTSGRVTFAGASGLLSDSANLVWDNTNARLGIGTSSPSYPLSVAKAGNSSIVLAQLRNSDAGSSAATSFAFGNDTSAEAARIVYGSSTNSTIPNTLFITNDLAGSIILRTDGTERMRITSAGDVGIGTSSPVQKLQVSGAVGNPATSGSTQNGIIRLSNPTDNGVLDIGLRSGGNGAWLQSTDGGAGGMANQYALLLNPVGGDVGIGTSSPSARLGILAGSMNSQILLGVSTSNSAYGSISLNGSSADNGRLGFTGGGTGDNTLYIDVPTNGAYGFRLGGTNVITVNSSGIVTMGAYGAGAATFSASGVISSVSDETWKTKDGVPTNPDVMLQNLEPGYWFYNEEKAPIFGQDRQLGFYAQNVHEAIGAEAAPTPEEGKPWGYYDRSVLAVVVMSLKTALNTIEELKQRIETLENK